MNAKSAVTNIRKNSRFYTSACNIVTVKKNVKSTDDDKSNWREKRIQINQQMHFIYMCVGWQEHIQNRKEQMIIQYKPTDPLKDSRNFSWVDNVK